MTELSAPPSIGRREARRRDRRDAILAVAGRSFLENGFAGTTMSSIAAELGGSKGTLWSYFPSKETLFAAVLDQETATYRERLSEILDPSEELIPTLRCFCISLLEKVTSAEAIALHRLMATEAGRFPEMGAIFYEHAPRYTRALLARYIEGAMERGLLRHADPTLAARALMTLAMSNGHQQMIWGLADTMSPDQIAEDIDVAMDLFMRAYAP